MNSKAMNSKTAACLLCHLVKRFHLCFSSDKTGVVALTSQGFPRALW